MIDMLINHCAVVVDLYIVCKCLLHQTNIYAW